MNTTTAEKMAETTAMETAEPSAEEEKKMSAAEPYYDWESVPIVLKATDIMKITGLSKPTVYALIHSKGFPAIKMSERRIVIPKDAFRQWMDLQALNKKTVPAEKEE